MDKRPYRRVRILGWFLLVPLAIAACSETSDSDQAGGSGGDAGNGGSGGTPVVNCENAIDFEDGCGPFAFTDFDGGVATIVDNPDPTGINTTPRVVRMQKFAGADFGGSSLSLPEVIDWSAGTAFTMKVWSQRRVPVLFKLEGLNQERPDLHSGGGAWEELCFDFAGSTEGPDAEAMTFIFDLGTVGDAGGDPENWTFYFDGISQVDDCGGSEVQWELIFEDEFDTGPSPSPDTWNFETGYGPDGSGWGNNEWQRYTDSPENVRVEDGNLVISALCDPPCGIRDDSITSARITTLGKFSFRFGRVEARIKPPVGRAAWPAFWALGTSFPTIGWPRSGEIDFMELHNAFSNERTTHFTIHWCDETIQAPEPCSFPDGWMFFSQNRTFDTSLGDDFHVFEAEWDEDKVIGKIDGLVYFTQIIDPETMEEFLGEFFLILNVAMGGTLGSNNQPPNGSETFPQTMLVDYVRVYRRVD